MFRITYNRQDNKLISKGEILAKDKLVRVEIEGLTASIIAIDSKDTVLTTLTSPTIETLQKRVKTSLKRLGVVFEEEVRNKKIKEENIQND